MFDFVHKHKRLLQLVLLILIGPPFVFWGIDSYNQSRSDTSVAVVDDHKITVPEFTQAIKNYQERMRGVLGRNFDPSTLDTPEIRTTLLDNLINQRILINRAVRNNMVVTDDQLRDIISTVPLFQDQGKFSRERYEIALRNQGLTPVVFESQLRQELLLQQLQDAYTDSQIIPNAVIESFHNSLEQGREVSQMMLTLDQFTKQIKVDPEAVKNYYNSHQIDFQTPEQVRIEYVLLNAESQLAQLQISPNDVRKYYDEHLKQFEQPETRQASHILIGVKPDASEADKAAAKEKANQILKQALAAPKSFAALSKQHSQDTGSARQGGDLGSFPRGVMVKPFEDTTFEMKVGEIKIVQSEFGFHIIKLNGIKPGKTMDFNEVKGNIEQELKRQTANKKFAEVAESFSNMVFEQPDSLQPVAEKFKLQIQRSPWLSRKDAQAAGLNNEKFLQALFSNDVLQNKRNTEAVEFAPGVLISARVVEHKPTAVLPLSNVSAEIGKRIQREEAAKLAAAEGNRVLTALQEGKAPAVKWGSARLLTRQKILQELNKDVVRKIFSTSIDKLPVYTGIENPDGGFYLFKISKVVAAPAMTEAQKKSYQQNLQKLMVQEEMAAYLIGLRQNTKIKIKQDALQKTSL
jgi:peptidyl-prolyl cis-trans isomerase D